MLKFGCPADPGLESQFERYIGRFIAGAAVGLLSVAGPSGSSLKMDTDLARLHPPQLLFETGCHDAVSE